MATLAGALALTALIYFPGLHGPFLFDDTVNILRNPALRITGLDPAGLWQAAWSMQSGPLGRPVAYLSFALDYLADGQRFAAPAFKRTNLAIHLLTVLAAAALAWQMGARVLAGQPGRRAALAVLTAALFAVHPLALSPVLYVVQRMASLSTLFALLAVCCLLRARVALTPTAMAAGPASGSRAQGALLQGNATPPSFVGAGHARDETAAAAAPSANVRHSADVQLPGRVHGARLPPPDPAAAPPAQPESPVSPHRASAVPLLRAAAWATAGLLLTGLGVLTKETALLVPLLYLLADRVCFPDSPWWRLLAAPSRAGQTARLGLAVLVGLIAGLVAWHFADQYGGRDFTLTERVLTQARVLCFYLSLYLLPRIDAFGLYHDDIAISTGLLTPWTTLPALLAIAALVALGLMLLRVRPLVGFGLLWFFAGHALESTVVPLEIAHEHRNYLPLFGLAVASADGMLMLWQRQRQVGVAAIAAVLAVLTATTALRAAQWGHALDFHRYQVAHHPRSAASLNDYARALVLAGDVDGALAALTEAQRLKPNELGHYVNYALTARVNDRPLPAEVDAALDRLLAAPTLSAFGVRSLSTLGDCLRDVCKVVAPDMARWLGVYLGAHAPRPNADYFEFLRGIALAQMGEIGPALNALERSWQLSPQFLNPLFEQANLFLALRQWDNAQFNLERIRKANDDAWVRRDREIGQLEAAIAQGRAADAAAAP